MILVFYLEGRSDREFLKNFLPRKFPKIKDNSVEVRYIIFEGKIGMNQYLKKKLQSYRDSRKSHFIILRDQDSENCIKVKEVLTQICQSAGKTNFSIRIACRELENWYIGNLAAIGKIYNIPNLEKQQNKNKYRNPDNLSGYREILECTKQQYQKIDGSRKLGANLNLDNNCSHSFKIFCEGIEKILQTTL